MPPSKLSLCIPTYNFGKFIAETLRSILEQDGADEIEVVVVDGASTDDTPQIVSALQEQYPQIKYFRLPAKGGIDRDMAKAVELATGDYCWLFSSDDVMRAGALQFALHEIGKGYDVYLCRHMEYTIDMKFRSEYPIFPLHAEEVFNLADPSARVRYFNLAMNTEAFFSFMGGTIVKKSVWDSIPLNEAFVGSCWAHVARMFEIMRKGLTIKYVARAFINRRGDNDSFMDKGYVHRFRIGIDGYHRLADTFFGHDSMEAFHIRRVLKNEFTLPAFLAVMDRCTQNPGVESQTLLDALARKIYCDRTYDNYRNYMTYIAHKNHKLLMPLKTNYRKARQIYRETFDLETRKFVRKILGSALRTPKTLLKKSLRRPARNPNLQPMPEEMWGRVFNMNDKQLVELDDFGLYVMPDDYIGYSIMQSRSYEPHVTKLIRSVLKRGDVFMDVGANVGYFTFLGATLVKKEGKVIAFEPNPQNLHLIYSTMRVSPGMNIHVYPYAVSDSKGILKFVTVGSNGGVVNDHNSDHAHSLLVPSVIMDEVLEHESKIDLIKMDIEAHEPAAVRGMGALLRKHKPGLITEFHPWAMKHNNKEPPVAYLEQLYDLGYALSIIETSGNVLPVSGTAEILSYWQALNSETIHLDLYAQPR